MKKHIQYRTIDDAYVKPETPVLDVPDIRMNTIFQLAQFLDLTPETLDLSPTCNARLYPVAHHIAVHQLTIRFRMRQHVRTRTHDGHVALEYIDELRKFVYVCPAHEIAKAELSRVILCRLNLIRRIIQVHRAELDAFELLTVQSTPLLEKEDRTWALTLDDDSHKDVDDGEDGQQEKTAEEHVEDTFDDAVSQVAEWLRTRGEHDGGADRGYHFRMEAIEQ